MISLLLVLLVVSAAGYAFYRYARELANFNACGNNTKQIGLALLNYLDQFGRFPPAHLCELENRLRVGARCSSISGTIGTTSLRITTSRSPWGSPKNFALIGAKTLYEIQCPAAGENPGVTSYVAVVGPDTMWPGCTPAKPAADGSDDDKILVIEVVNSDINWREPRDLTLEEALDANRPKNKVRIGSWHRKGIRYVTVGGEVRTLDPNIDREALKKLLVRNPKNVQPPNAGEKMTGKSWNEEKARRK